MTASSSSEQNILSYYYEVYLKHLFGFITFRFRWAQEQTQNTAGVVKIKVFVDKHNLLVRWLAGLTKAEGRQVGGDAVVRVVVSDEVKSEHRKKQKAPDNDHKSTRGFTRGKLDESYNTARVTE